VENVEVVIAQQWNGSTYLGPERGRWAPQTWQEVLDAAGGGLLDESHWLDLKRELNKSRPDNAALAQDLASLAIDGGVLIIGIEDHESRAGAVRGVELGQLADRVDQVARAKVHPPLLVRSVEVRDPDRPGWGCLIVHVPASPQAPHMVDNVYYGRGDRANRKLGDEEVRSILARGAQQHQDVAEQLSRLAQEDPVPDEHRSNGHLYLIAQPLATTDEAMVELLAADDLVAQVFTLTSEISKEIGDRFAPSIRDAIGRVRRAEGVALTSHSGREQLYEPGLIDLVIREDGGLSLICGRGTDQTRASVGHDPVSVVFPVVVLGVTHSVLALAGRLTDRHVAYQGLWTVGIRVDRLMGVVPYDQTRFWGDLGNPYSRDVYEKLTSTTTEELVTDTSAVVERLLGSLLRGLGVASRYLPYSTDSLSKSPQ